MIYHRMNKSIGSWGNVMYVHNNVPGVIAFIYEGDTTILYCLRMSRTDNGLMPAFVMPTIVWPNGDGGTHLTSVWGWVDTEIARGYRLHGAFGTSDVEREIETNFRSIEAIYKDNIAAGRS